MNEDKNEDIHYFQVLALLGITVLVLIQYGLNKLLGLIFNFWG